MSRRKHCHWHSSGPAVSERSRMESLKATDGSEPTYYHLFYFIFKSSTPIIRPSDWISHHLGSNPSQYSLIFPL